MKVERKKNTEGGVSREEKVALRGNPSDNKCRSTTQRPLSGGERGGGAHSKKKKIPP